MMTDLHAWGLDASWRATYAAASVGLERAARVVGEQRGAYILVTSHGQVKAVAAGALRHALLGGAGYRPAVGDWVVLRAGGTEFTGRQIETVLPRRTHVTRKAAGKATKQQVLAANVDTVFVVCAFGGDINGRKIERFLAIASAGGANPVVLLNKKDLAGQNQAESDSVALLTSRVEMHAVCAFSGEGFESLAPYLLPGRTVALIGSSGAGKTTMLNRWLHTNTFLTGAVGPDGQGKHTTRARQLVASPSGVLIIDTPGLREVGVWAADSGIAATFSDVLTLATQCRYRNCTHGHEISCAVREAVTKGEIEESRFMAWLQLRDEAQGHAPAKQRGPRGTKRRR